MVAYVLGGEANCFKSISCRFASPVYPGDELTTVMWIVGDKDGKITVAFTCLVATTVVLTSGVAVLVSAKAAKL